MFLDEELEKIYNENGHDVRAAGNDLMQACFNRLPDPEGYTVRDWLNELRKIESGWRLFCSRHTELSPDGFKNVMITKIGVPESVKKALKW